MKTCYPEFIKKEIKDYIYSLYLQSYDIETIYFKIQEQFETGLNIDEINEIIDYLNVQYV